MNAASALKNTAISARVGLVLAAALVVGAAYAARGPDMRYVPEMAARPVVMSDGRPFYVQKFEISVAEWNRCHRDGGCEEPRHAPAGMPPARTPVTQLSHLDIEQYLRWINRRSRHPFRLPTRAEWEQMAKAVTPEKPDPIFTDPELSWASAYLTEGVPPRKLEVQGNFTESPEGIADLDGSVWEWTDDCYAGDSGIVPKELCPAYWVGGEHIAAVPFVERDPARGGCAVGAPPAHLGFRLVTDRMPARH
jgi:formylglycine-generating enzyme required for sulfatase activity